MVKNSIMGNILEVLRKNETFLISSHINPDGDSIGSQLALYSILSDLGKKVSVLNSDPVPLIYGFLPNVEVCNSEFRLEGESTFDCDVAIILDCGDLSRIGDKIAERISSECALINIDHHRGNKQFGTYNLIDVEACATAEIIFRLIEYAGMEIGQDRAVCLYTGILTDTGSFKYSNTTPEAHRIAARLIGEGVSPHRITKAVYETIPYPRAKLFGMAVGRTQISSDGKIVWTSVTGEMHAETQTGSADTEGIIDYIRSIKGIEVAIFLREIENGSFKVSLRSKSGLRVDEIASMFGGGGHKAAAGCNIPGTLDEVTHTILKAARNRMFSGN